MEFVAIPVEPAALLWAVLRRLQESSLVPSATSVLQHNYEALLYSCQEVLDSIPATFFGVDLAHLAGG